MASQNDCKTSTLLQSKIWYTDGSVVIKAENTVFRVHASLLSQHSAMFNDMFRLASPLDDQVEGCPIVSVTDSAKDWKIVLTALYDRCVSQNVWCI